MSALTSSNIGETEQITLFVLIGQFFISVHQNEKILYSLYQNTKKNLYCCISKDVIFLYSYIDIFYIVGQP